MLAARLSNATVAEFADEEIELPLRIRYTKLVKRFHVKPSIPLTTFLINVV